MRNFIYILILLLPYNLFGQPNAEIGFPLIKNYSPKEYGAANQNWAIIQGKTGVMYFGNTGVLQYDGFDWRITSLANNSVARSFSIDENGRIYVGGVGDFGYLQPDSIGKIRFISLLKFVPKQYKEFADVWCSSVDGENVFFTTDSYVFRWSSKRKKMKVWKASNAFHVSYLISGKFYIREWGKGLLKLRGDSLQLIPSSEQFADERIYAMLAMPDNSKNILVVTRTKGLFLFDGTKFTPFKTEADEFIKENLIYLPGLVLDDGNIALGTLTGGLLIMNPKGEIVNIFNTNTGLPSNTIYFIYQDNAGAIWLGQEYGISKIAYGSSATYFDDRKGITETPYDMERYKGILYVSTNSGVYYLDTTTSLFQLVKNSPITQCFALTIFNDRLVAGTNEGLYEIENNKALPIRKSVNKDFEVGYLLSSEYESNRLYVGTKGVNSHLLRNNKWINEGIILKVRGFITSIVETVEGNLWVTNTVNGIHRVRFKRENKGKIIFTDPKIEFFDDKNGLPEGGFLASKVLGEIFFSTREGIYRFDESKNQFYLDDSTFSFVHRKNYSDGGFFAFEDSLGRVWASGGAEPALGMPQKDGSYNWITSPFKRFSNENIVNIYPDKNNIVWFLTPGALIRYSKDMNADKSKEYDALISNVSIGADSTIFFGGLEKQNFIPEIGFDNNSIKFRYSAASYEDVEANKFKLYLAGFDKNWSSWSSEHIKEYTNLSPGEYTFKVKAKNSSNIESNEASFSLVILAPWYRTWWAYTIYAACLGLLFVGIDRFQKRRVISKEREQSKLRETELRAEAAEAKANVFKSENDRKKNIEMLSEIGKEITASLNLETIFHRLYEHVNLLADASIFGVGIYHPKKQEIEYRLAYEKGKKYPPYSRDIKDKNQFPVWCIINRKPIFINDVRVEYKNYIENYKEPERRLEDGTMSEEPLSLIYLPLISKERLLGVITIQSFKKNAYEEYHLNLLQNLAAYTSIAIDNADAYRQLNETVTKLDNAINDLKSTQEKLIVQQKLASLGQLTAGIAHEIKNPLNFVNNFAEVSVELVGELKEEISKFKHMVSDSSALNMMEIIKDLEENSLRINQHGKRADSIVKSMLQHSRGKSGEKSETDINAIIDEDINLAYHGMRARDTSFNVTIEKDFDRNLQKVSVVPQDVSRVFLNIINNGFYETGKKQKMLNNSFSPVLRVATYDFADRIEVHIRDNGNGIPADARDKLFEPFFTTKPSGEGTGLGLSLSHDIIVKQHGGEIKFETEEGEFTEFIITLPKNGA